MDYWTGGVRLGSPDTPAACAGAGNGWGAGPCTRPGRPNHRKTRPSERPHPTELNIACWPPHSAPGLIIPMPTTAPKFGPRRRKLIKKEIGVDAALVRWATKWCRRGETTRPPKHTAPTGQSLGPTAMADPAECAWHAGGGLWPVDCVSGVHARHEAGTLIVCTMHPVPLIVCTMHRQYCPVNPHHCTMHLSVRAPCTPHCVHYSCAPSPCALCTSHCVQYCTSNCVHLVLLMQPIVHYAPLIVCTMEPSLSSRHGGTDAVARRGVVGGRAA